MDERPHVYRAYYLDRKGGIVRAEHVQALSDDEALAHVRSTPNDHGVEIWDRARQVVVLPPQVSA